MAKNAGKRPATIPDESSNGDLCAKLLTIRSPWKVGNPGVGDMGEVKNGMEIQGSFIYLTKIKVDASLWSSFEGFPLLLVHEVWVGVI